MRRDLGRNESKERDVRPRVRRALVMRGLASRLPELHRTVSTIMFDFVTVIYRAIFGCRSWILRCLMFASFCILILV
jgi:hypothetical protein